MRENTRSVWSGLRASVIAMGVWAQFAVAQGAGAQRFVEVEPDPNQPVKEGFDLDRAMLFAAPNFVPFRNPAFQSLSKALRAGDVAEDTPVLVFEAGGVTLVFVTEQMAYHHVAQGDMRGEPWMVTF